MRRTTALLGAVAAIVAAALVLPALVFAQDEPLEEWGLEQRSFSIEEPFAPGEVWQRELRAGRTERDAGGETLRSASVAWTDSARVLDRTEGWFTLEATLQRFESRERDGVTLTTRRYAEEDLERLLAPREGADPAAPSAQAARTWVYRFGPDWRLEEVRGPTRTVAQLLAYLAYRDGRDPDREAEGLARLYAGVEAWVRDLLAQLGGSWLAEQIEEETNRVLAPVQQVMARLRAGPIEPGAELLLDPRPDGQPSGRVRYLGRDAELGRFEVRDAAPRAGEPVPDMRFTFAIDTAGRLRAVDVVRRERRADRTLERTLALRLTDVQRPALTAEEPRVW